MELHYILSIVILVIAGLWAIIAGGVRSYRWIRRNIRDIVEAHAQPPRYY